jgi:WD40 repeat protein
MSRSTIQDEINALIHHADETRDRSRLWAQIAGLRSLAVESIEWRSEAFLATVSETVTELQVGDTSGAVPSTLAGSLAEGDRCDFLGHTSQVIGVSWSPDGRKLASASNDKTVKIWTLADGTCERTLSDSGHSSTVWSISWSPDGRRLASASKDNTVKIWTADGTYEKTLSAQSKAVHGVSWSPDGRQLASACNNSTVKIWTVDGTGEQTLSGHSHRVQSVSWSPDGRRLASASQDNTVKIWTANGTCEHTLSGHSHRVNDVSWSPDGRRLASASYDDTVKIWTADGTCEHTLSGHSNQVLSVSWSPDGRRLASASSDNTVKIWTAEGGLVQSYDIGIGGNHGCNSVAWHPSGAFLAARHGSNIKVLRLEVADSSDSEAVRTLQARRPGRAQQALLVMRTFQRQYFSDADPLVSGAATMRLMMEHPRDLDAMLQEATPGAGLRGIALAKAAFLALESTPAEQGQPAGNVPLLRSLFEHGLGPNTCEPLIAKAQDLPSEWTVLGLNPAHDDPVVFVTEKAREVPDSHIPIPASILADFGLPCLNHGKTLLDTALAQHPINWDAVNVILEAGADITFGNVLESISDWGEMPDSVQAMITPLFNSDKHVTGTDIGLAVATAVKVIHQREIEVALREASLPMEADITPPIAQAALQAAAGAVAEGMKHAALVTGMTAASMHQMFDVIPVLGMALGGVVPAKRAGSSSRPDFTSGHTKGKGAAEHVAGHGGGDGSGFGDPQ